MAKFWQSAEEKWKYLAKKSLLWKLDFQDNQRSFTENHKQTSIETDKKCQRKMLNRYFSCSI